MHFIQYFVLCMLVNISVAWADELRVDASNLNQNLTKYVILDARSPDLYQVHHIMGARNFPASLTYQNQEIDGKIKRSK